MWWHTQTHTLTNDNEKEKKIIWDIIYLFRHTSQIVSRSIWHRIFFSSFYIWLALREREEGKVYTPTKLFGISPELTVTALFH